MSNTSIDELLRYEEEGSGDRRLDPTWIWVGRTLISAAALTALVVIGARFVGVGLPVVVVFAVILALIVLRRILRDVAPVPLTHVDDRWTRDDDWQLTWPSPDGASVAAVRWETRLSWTQHDPERFARTVRPVLADLVDERLRQRHSVTCGSDPARARELLGDPLWIFLTTPVIRTPAPHQLAAFVEQVEKL